MQTWVCICEAKLVTGRWINQKPVPRNGLLEAFAIDLEGGLLRGTMALEGGVRGRAVNLYCIRKREPVCLCNLDTQGTASEPAASTR